MTQTNRRRFIRRGVSAAAAVTAVALPATAAAQGEKPVKKEQPDIAQTRKIGEEIANKDFDALTAVLSIVGGALGFRSEPQRVGEDLAFVHGISPQATVRRPENKPPTEFQAFSISRFSQLLA